MTAREIVIGQFVVELRHGDGTKTLLNHAQWRNCASADLFHDARILYPDAPRVSADKEVPR